MRPTKLQIKLNVLRGAENELVLQYGKRLAAADAEIIEALAPLMERMTEAIRARCAAQAEVDAEAVELARVGDNGPAPIGTRFVAWKTEWFSKRKHITDSVAVVEVWSRDSEHHGGMRHCLPSPGDFVLRELKKDGTPSARFYRFPRHECGRVWGRGHIWLQEGVTPEGAEVTR
jgi:hypothetical protein